MSEEAKEQLSEDTDQPSGPMQIEVSPTVWAEFLDIVNLGELISPLEVFFENDSTCSVRASDKTKSIQYILPEWTLFGATVTNAKTIVIDPLELLADMSKFKKSRSITINVEDNVMNVYDDKNNEITYHLKAATSAVTIPASKVPKFDSMGSVLFKKKVKDDEGNDKIEQGPADTIVQIDSTQIQKSVDDMIKHAKTEYVEFHFTNEGCFSRTGHMGAKSKTSQSGLVATVSGFDFDFVVPKTFATLVSPFEGEIEIQGALESPGVVLRHKKIGKGDVIVVLMRQRTAKRP